MIRHIIISERTEENIFILMFSHPSSIVLIVKSNGCTSQARVAGMVTLFVDGFIPFLVISILNTLIIRAIKQRHYELESFKQEATSNSLENENPKQGVNKAKDKGKLNLEATSQ